MLRVAANDKINLLSKATAPKLLNATKVLSSYYQSRFSGKATHRGLPISISLEPTTSCNLRCPECPSGLRSFTRPTGMANEDFLKRAINELAHHLLYITFYFQGEPYLHLGFLELVNHAHTKNIYTATSTNAHFLHEENARKTVESGLDRLIISIDGTTQQSYEHYRVGGNLNKVIEGTQNVINWKKKLHSRTPYVIFQFLVLKRNEHEMNDVKGLGAELGVDEVRFKSAQFYDFENGNERIPMQENFSRYKKNQDGRFSIKNKLLNHCWKMWHSCVITWDGKVVPCCFDKDAQHVLGDLNQQSFDEIWNGENYLQFRQSLLKSRKEIDICSNCSEGMSVWMG
jgi:radical SAM protein with 4Fe4S-binding SPASM domain